MRPLILIGLLVLVSLLAMLMAISIGSVELSPTLIWQVISGSSDEMSRYIVLELRLPRATNAFTTGALLAVAGSLMQVLLRNPLADPYILGVSGGASVAALLAILLGISGWFLNLSAFAGALLAILLVFGLARGHGAWNPTRLLLTGVVLASGWGAAITFILTIAPSDSVHGMLFWLMGDLSYGGTPGYALVVLILGLLAVLPLARAMNVLRFGELQAQALGLDIRKLHISLYLLASLFTAAAVIQAGSVGFIGLIVPHMLRLSGLGDHRYLLPASVFGGGALLLIADTLARTLVAPQQLPVGVISAAIGVPLFLFLLYRGRLNRV